MGAKEIEEGDVVFPSTDAARCACVFGLEREEGGGVQVRSVLYNENPHHRICESKVRDTPHLLRTCHLNGDLISCRHHTQPSTIGILHTTINVSSAFPYQVQYNTSNILKAAFAAGGDFFIIIGVFRAGGHYRGVYYDDKC
jgi:hypothetical protein